MALLGASAGASTAVWIMVRIIELCFKRELKEGGRTKALKAMIPSYGKSLIDDDALCRRVRADTAEVLHLHNI